jgi:hypothetical protein
MNTTIKGAIGHLNRFLTLCLFWKIAWRTLGLWAGEYFEAYGAIHGAIGALRNLSDSGVLIQFVNMPERNPILGSTLIPFV